MLCEMEGSLPVASTTTWHDLVVCTTEPAMAEERYPATTVRFRANVHHAYYTTHKRLAGLLQYVAVWTEKLRCPPTKE